MPVHIHAVPEVFVRICELGILLGTQDRIRSPEGWTHQLDDTWYFVLNGTRETQTIIVAPRGGYPGNAEVPPFTAITYYNGWPQGFYNPADAYVAGSAFVPENSPEGLDGQLCDLLQAAITAASGAAEARDTERRET